MGHRSERTVHATALVLSLRGRARGLLVTGPSGAGKSSLAALLLERAALQGRFARLVADDRVALRATHGRLLARCPPALAGRLEMRGAGIVRVLHLAAARIHAHAALVATVERMPEPDADEWHGVALPRLAVAAADPLAAAGIEHWLAGNIEGLSTGE